MWCTGRNNELKIVQHTDGIGVRMNTWNEKNDQPHKSQHPVSIYVKVVIIIAFDFHHEISMIPSDDEEQKED